VNARAGHAGMGEREEPVQTRPKSRARRGSCCLAMVYVLAG
jgi:hypothetical protein